MPHGHCYLWLPDILLLHVISDTVIFLAYFSIPVSLIQVIRRRPDIGFTKLFFWFAAFIFACGLTHLMEVWTVWYGTYRLSGLLKAITAGVSAFAAYSLWELIPLAVRIQTPKQVAEHEQRLSQVNEQVRDLIKTKNRQSKELELQKLLLDELDHRVKNLLAVVLSIAQQTIRSTPDLMSFQENFTGRLQNLARIQKLLRGHLWRAIPLKDLILSSIEPYTDASTERVRVAGPFFSFGAEKAQAIHTILYELATNAAKYGAFSTPEGTIDIQWDTISDRKEIEIRWLENLDSLPSSLVDASEVSEGFGSRIIKQMTTHQLQGSVSWDYKPSGLHLFLRFPIDKSPTASESHAG